MNEPATPAPVILVVEDEALVRMLAVDVLEEAGFEVVEASTRSARISAWCSRASTCPAG
jgi:CheY-like chemotaxis protein